MLLRYVTIRRVSEDEKLVVMFIVVGTAVGTSIMCGFILIALGWLVL